jgi:hypothetical protein
MNKSKKFKYNNGTSIKNSKSDLKYKFFSNYLKNLLFLYYNIVKKIYRIFNYLICLQKIIFL